MDLFQLGGYMSVNSRPIIFEEDGITSGYIVNSCEVEIVQGKPVFKIPLIEQQRIEYNTYKYLLKYDPAMLLKMLKESSLPPTQTIHLRNRASIAVLDSLKAEIIQKDVLKSISKYPENIKIEKEITKLKEIEENHKNGLDRSLNKEIGFDNEWNNSLKKYYKKAWEFLKSSQQSETGQVLFDSCMHKFYELRKLRPLSLEPYYPWITLLAGVIHKKELKIILEEAKQCDPYLTYALVMFHVRVQATTEHKFFLIEPHTVLEVMNEVYPSDLLLPPYLKALDSKTVQLDLSEIGDCLEKSLQKLFLNDFQNAINLLVIKKPYLIGVSTLYRYMALVWAIEGHGQKADEILNRALRLPDLKNPVTSFLGSEYIKVFSEIIVPEVIKEEKNDPLEKFIALVNGQHDSKQFFILAKNFIDSSYQSLSKNLNNLPEIYFGVRWLTSCITTKPGEFKNSYRPLFCSLFDLIAVTANICFQSENVDDWIIENFEKVLTEKDKGHFVIQFSTISFGNPEKEIAPSFVFLGDLSLAPKSVSVITTSLTKQIYQLIFGLIIAETTICFEEDEKKASNTLCMSLLEGRGILPDNPTMFTKVLNSGLTTPGVPFFGKDNFFSFSSSYLREYENSKISPFRINPIILEWAKFSVFSQEPIFSPSDSLDNAIIKNYYPDGFNVKRIEHLYNLLRKCSDKEIPSHLLRISLRDAYLAMESIQKRSSQKMEIVDLSVDANLYKVFQTSLQLFGWRFNETFVDWGKRLIEKKKFGLTLSDYQSIKHINLASTTEKPSLQASFEYKKAVPILDFFLDFWLNFHQITTEKNNHILNGSDDDGNMHKKDWSKGLKMDLCIDIVNKNAPEKYPEYKTLKKQEQEALRKDVLHKHKKELEHKEALDQLEKFNKSINKQVEGQDLLIMLSAVLLTNGEYDRKEKEPNVLVNTEVEAQMIYQVLLEVAIERIMRTQIRTSGSDAWKLQDLEKVHQLLSGKLKAMIGKFHGPECHFTGDAPMQSHFNAGSCRSTLNLINTHIFFKK